MGLLVIGFTIFCFSFVFSLFAATSNSRSVKARKYREEDFWDEPDGTMYVQLPNGDVRLD